METTLNKIKAAGACEDRYAHLLKALGKTRADDEPLPIAKIVELNGIQDAVWALRTIKGHDRELRLFACDCAEMVLPLYEKEYHDDDRPFKAIDVARRYANGDADDEELAAAWAEAGAEAGAAAWAAAWAAVWYAAWAAVGAAAWAARAAAWAAARAAAWAAAGAAAQAAQAAAWAKIETILRKYL